MGMSKKMKDSYQVNKGKPAFNQFMKDNYNPGDTPAARGVTLKKAFEILIGV